MTGHEYADLITNYILYNFEDRGIEIYREVNAGKSKIGKNRRIDILVICKNSNQAVAIECKYQSTSGTVDEKIPYALEDMQALPMPGFIVYAGSGFSQGVLHMLQASELAVCCLPRASNLKPSKETWELNHMLAMHFHWWDVFVGNRRPARLGQKYQNLKLL
jgi:hypothetical protein